MTLLCILGLEDINFPYYNLLESTWDCTVSLCMYSRLVMYISSISPCFWDTTPIISLMLVAPTEEVCRDHDSAQLVGGWGWKKEFTNEY